MKQSDLPGFAACCLKALQQCRAVHALISGAIDPAVKGGDSYRLQPAPEHGDIVRPPFLHPGTANAAKIVVSRRDEHRHGAVCQGIADTVHRLSGGNAVKNIPCQQHQVALLPAADFSNLLRECQLLTAQEAALRLGKGDKRGIHVPVGGVQNS